MLHVKTFSFNLLQENTYVVYDDTNECVIIDCGAYYQEERDALVRYTANQMKRDLAQFGHGSMDDERVASDLARFTDGAIQIDLNAFRFEKVAQADEKKKKKK